MAKKKNDDAQVEAEPVVEESPAQAEQAPEVEAEAESEVDPAADVPEEGSVAVHLYAAGLRIQYGAKNAADVVEVPASVAQHVVKTGLGCLAKAGAKVERATNEPG
ncbi:MAG: hypothetical protein AAF389_14850 [Gemmatimonadota bacterium]